MWRLSECLILKSAVSSSDFAYLRVLLCALSAHGIISLQAVRASISAIVSKLLPANAVLLTNQLRRRFQSASGFKLTADDGTISRNWEVAAESQLLHCHSDVSCSSFQPYRIQLCHSIPYTNSIDTRRPTIAAARCRLPSVMSFLGSRIRST